MVNPVVRTWRSWRNHGKFEPAVLMEIAQVSKCVALVLLATLTALPQSSQPQPQPVPLLRSSSRLVLLDVVVTDKQGHPIRGLTKDDFTVVENGIPQKLLSFESSSDNQTRDTAAHSRTIILLDQLNIAFADLAYARDRIVIYLEQHPVEHQPTALLEVGVHGLAMVQDFTEDSNLLMEKLTHLHAVTANPSNGYMDPGKAQEHAQKALGALTQLARASVGSPYSLNVIWVTGGFSGLLKTSKNDASMEAGLRSVATLLISSRMRLYTIDPAGVLPLSAIADSGRVSRGDIREGHESSAEGVLQSTHGEQLAADQLLSHMTRMMGGLSYFRRNDVEQALGQAMLDGASAYSVAYAPSNTEFRGEYRKIEVHTKVEGASARTRNGYYATANDQAPDPDVKEARLSAALSSPLLYSGSSLSCRMTFDAAQDRVQGKLVVTPHSVGLATDQTGQIIRAASFSGDGKMLNDWSWKVEWKVPWTSHPVSAYFNKTVSPKARRVRFLVSDPAADRIGTCEYEVPAAH